MGAIPTEELSVSNKGDNLLVSSLPNNWEK